MNVVCIDAWQAHQSLKAMKANKTAPHDAAGLAQLARTGFYKPAFPGRCMSNPRLRKACVQGLVFGITARAHLVAARVRLDNTIRGPCITFGIKVGPGQGKEFVQRARDTVSIPGLGKAVASLLAVRDDLIAEIKALDKVLNADAKTSTACQILMSIPGVGVQTSAAFAATIDEVDRFKQSRAAGAYFGLVPRRYQSGEVDWTGRITKQGDSMVKKLLYEAANSILMRTRKSFALKSWAQKIARRCGLRKARVALARRLAVIMHAPRQIWAAGRDFVRSLKGRKTDLPAVTPKS